MKRFVMVVLFLVIGFILGINYAIPRNIWDMESSSSFDDFNRKLGKDKSERLVLIVLTENGQYNISRLSNDFRINLTLEKVTP